MNRNQTEPLNCEELDQQLSQLVKEWLANDNFKTKCSLVIGCSTSEVMGHVIGTLGNEQVAERIFKAMKQLQEKTGVVLLFQCCEHLNRALVTERNFAEAKGYDPVHVVPALKAGGAMATYAYRNLDDPVLIEFAQVEAGIDIGDSMIGMHIKHVAVPVRLEQNQIGHARVNAAYTRPKLIGGERAVYR
ncbi:TIGR01440 family protein [Amphibacillus jilinensis]|uniref:TIGR01440 family protein n=1 Tax=Amphibacillus jilinensis TaxID=1216008 RepID=UPI0002E53745|nr:TIGR01440 family protein [Amphibacillus jilinensis]